jgi:hypothetical protein
MATRKSGGTVQVEGPRRKLRLSVVIDAAVVERAKNAVYWTPGLTLATITEQALVAALDKLEHRRGEPFPPREAGLRVGRPVR